MTERVRTNLLRRSSSLSKALVASAMVFALSGLLLWSGARERPVHAANGAKTAGGSPAYTAEGKMLVPENYREWIYLSTGHDMSYTPPAAMAGMAMQSRFDNVFVNPESYRSFLKTGTWPDKTVLLIEVRGAKTRGSINQSGQFQGMDVMALEVHVKDEARTPGAWAFYEFDGPLSRAATMVPRTADCYSCHQQHAAVATTFVQFYPTLLPIAKAKNTLSADFLKENAAHQP